MSLPSQSTRAARSSGVSMRARRSSPLKKVGLPAVIIAALIVAVWFVMRPSQPTEALAGADTPDTIQSTDEQPTQLAQRDPEPLEIDQSAPLNALPGSDQTTRPRLESSPSTIDPQDPPASTTRDSQPDRDPDPDPIVNDTPAGSSLLEGTRRRAESSPRTPSGALAPIEQARALIASNQRVEARRLLSNALANGGLSEPEAAAIRGFLSDINQVLLFGPVVDPSDPICEEYTVQPGDSLSRIAARRELGTHWKLIQRLNNIANPSRIRLGQTLKLARGPFHAVVHKHAYRMDLYHGPPAEPSRWVFIRSVRVGLGLDNGTPVGTFVVSPNKLENPGWVNPRDASERYDPNDPDNPIGEYWIGLRGIGDSARFTGYGIHGTIEPNSIGREESMGCVRVADEDIGVVFELLAEGISRVEIRE